MSAPPDRRRSGRLLPVAVALSAIGLGLIGLRFLLDPGGAAGTFAGPLRPGAGVIERAVGLRDLWLAGLALALAWLGEWRALAVWFGLGAAVCAADALIVAGAGGAGGAVAFHAAAGVFWLGLTLACLRQARAGGSRPDG